MVRPLLRRRPGPIQRPEEHHREISMGPDLLLRRSGYSGRCACLAPEPGRRGRGDGRHGNPGGRGARGRGRGAGAVAGLLLGRTRSREAALARSAGGAAGTWATPAGDGKGDVPSDLATTDLYDRIAHNLFSINMVWTLIAGFLVMFMQAGFMMVETGLCRAKNAAHTIGDELHDLPARLPRVLGVRLRDRLGQLVERAGAAGLVCVARARACRC